MVQKYALVAGLWLNIPDYDAPSQMVKPKERNERYADAVLTIPKVVSSTLEQFLHPSMPSSFLNAASATFVDWRMITTCSE